MPTRPPHPCPRCRTNLTTSTYCPSCTSARNTEREYATPQYRNLRARVVGDWVQAHGFTCPGTPWCDTPDVPHPADTLTLDATVGMMHGGEHTLENVTVMCLTANDRKAAAQRTPTHRSTR